MSHYTISHPLKSTEFYPSTVIPIILTRQYNNLSLQDTTNYWVLAGECTRIAIFSVSHGKTKERGSGEISWSLSFLSFIPLLASKEYFYSYCCLLFFSVASSSIHTFCEFDKRTWRFLYSHISSS